MKHFQLSLIRHNVIFNKLIAFTLQQMLRDTAYLGIRIHTSFILIVKLPIKIISMTSIDAATWEQTRSQK